MKFGLDHNTWLPWTSIINLNSSWSCTGFLYEDLSNYLINNNAKFYKKLGWSRSDHFIPIFFTYSYCLWTTEYRLVLVTNKHSIFSVSANFLVNYNVIFILMFFFKTMVINKLCTCARIKNHQVNGGPTLQKS